MRTGMNIYDFDHTIYSGDSTIDFWRFCLRRYPAAILSLPLAVLAAVCFRLGICSRERFKGKFYKFLAYIPEIDKETELFWDKNIKKIETWYLEQKTENDLIISASPDFLISSVCRRLGTRWIASPVDGRTGTILGPNCRGEEKVRRLNQEYPGAKIARFYSDSLSDAPLASIADTAYLVKNGKIRDWKCIKQRWEGKETKQCV